MASVVKVLRDPLPPPEETLPKCGVVVIYRSNSYACVRIEFRACGNIAPPSTPSDIAPAGHWSSYGHSYGTPSAFLELVHESVTETVRSMMNVALHTASLTSWFVPICLVLTSHPVLVSVSFVVRMSVVHSQANS